jgi:PPOX class probable F420-dependent enzyme
LTSARGRINTLARRGGPPSRRLEKRGGTVNTDALRALQSERYISLETFKKDGTGVKTPVWFAEQDGALVVFTDGTSYKVKRIRRDSKARVAACDVRGNVHGPWFEAHAEILPKGGAASDEAYAALRRKYGLQMKLLDVVSTLGRRIGRREVVCVRF